MDAPRGRHIAWIESRVWMPDDDEEDPVPEAGEPVSGSFESLSSLSPESMKRNLIECDRIDRPTDRPTMTATIPPARDS